MEVKSSSISILTISSADRKLIKLMLQLWDKHLASKCLVQ